MVQVAKEKNHCLDFLKGIACFAVVFIHVKFPGIAGDAVWRLAQFAVPVFFLISGYFAYYNDSNVTKQNVTRRLKRIFWLSTYASAIYGVVRLIGKITKHTLLADFNISQAIEAVVNFLLLNDLDGITGGGHLWFLWALVYAYIFILVINKYNAWRLAYVIMALLFVFYVVLQSLGFDNDISWHYRGNWLASGIPYVTLGHYIAANKNKFFAVSNRTYGILTIMGALFSLWRVADMKHIQDCSELGIIIMSLSLFVLTLKNPTKVYFKTLEIIGNRYSLDIYIFHILVNTVVLKMITKAGLVDNIAIMWFHPLVVAMATLLWAMPITKLRKCLVRG